MQFNSHNVQHCLNWYSATYYFDLPSWKHKKEPVKMTFLGVNPFKSEYSDTHYQCHLSESDTTAEFAHVESFRTVRTRNTDDKNVDPPAPVWDDSNTYKHWKVTLSNNGNNDAFGVFGCEAALDGRITTSISGIFMRSNADIVPSDGLVSLTVNTGDTGVSIGMNSTGSKEIADFRWLKDSVRNGDISGQDTWSISRPVEVDDAGVYECHIHNERNGAKQSLKLLIVRACPPHRWGPDACDGICDNCYNGGICDETSGKCICAPGFKGTTCEEGCGGNRYGDACEKQCSSTDQPDRCSKYLFCLTHPYGCSCNTGWMGLDCLTGCDSANYGASCLQTCHCQSGQCDNYTGVCTGLSTDCSSGWTGTNCQVPDVCTTDYYGSTCTDKCHCMGNVACNKITGECPGQKCAPGYEVYMGEQNCAECLGPRFGMDCENDCHSESYCNKVTGSCSGGCNPEWVELFSPNFCQTGLIDAAYTPKNPGVTVPVNCTAAKGPSGSDINTLNFVLSRHHESLDDNGISSRDVTDDPTTTTTSFLVDNVTDGQTLYCQLRKDGQTYAVYDITIDVFDLPVLQSAPKADLITDSTVNISWSSWNEETEAGDPPVIGYIPYYKLESAQEWSAGSSTSIKTLSFIFTGLTQDESYSFSVAAVREGENGEGQRSPKLNIATMCAVPEASPMNVVAEVAGEDQENVKISWQVPTDDISCSSGVTVLTIFYASINLETLHEGEYNITDPSNTSLTLTDLKSEGNYSIHMTLATSGGESSSSDEIYYYVPRLPEYQSAPTVLHVSSDSLTINWPPWDGVIGTPPVVEYRLFTKRSESENWTSTFITVNASNDQEMYYVITPPLEPDTEYDFRVTAVREGPNGDGTPGPVLNRAKTYCHDPGITPTNVETSIAGDQQELINVTWTLDKDEIDCSTGVEYFTIYYSDTSEQIDDSNARWFVVEDLEPAENYSFMVTFSTSGGESVKSEESEILLPVLPALSDSLSTWNRDCETLTIQWDTWTIDIDQGTPPIIAYVPYHKNTSSSQWQRGENVKHNASMETHFYQFENLIEGTLYNFSIAVVREGYGGEGYPREHTDSPACNKGKSGLIAGSVTGSVCGIILIILVIFIITKRSKSLTDDHYDSGIQNNGFTGTTDLPKDSPKDLDSVPIADHVYSNIKRPAPIAVKQLESFMKNCGKTTSSIEEQFQLFKSDKQHPSDVGEKEENKQKNRFRNMIAYDHSRVVLQKLDDDPDSDYYNGNYIKNAKDEIGFIACQGPNTASLNDFWRMIWQEKVSNLVMLTNLIEKGKDRCLQYWPDSIGSVKSFGEIKIKLQKKEQYADFVMRELDVTFGDVKRKIRNWHYVTWPDMNVPYQATSLIRFSKKVKSYQTVTKAPLLVHCSAGVGRTGTFIALCSLMDVIETEEQIDIFGFVETMREDRIMMIQTAKQFKFLHDCLLEFYLSGDTDIPLDKVASFDVEANQDRLIHEFKLLAKLDKLSKTAHKATPEEATRCRFPSMVPVSQQRKSVHCHAIPVAVNC
ncbi:receptor-type tyrosine-protein phosphatase F-like isoform X3 [Apostichopus japonicus]|uniref:receptor-type tyrosine-protein phosphatase F-like isoform X3 n=1 Tax=Stichopus japonicus TaxID=307972 RepID=UPI003AB39F5D